MESKQTPQSPVSLTSPLSPPGLNRLDSSGRITLDLTIPASDVVLGDKLGQGAFGVVYKGQWRNKPVAIKQLLLPSPSEQEKTEFKHEAAVMFQIAADSEHVVRLYKITIQPHFSLVMELMPKGNLYELLQNNRDTPLLWEVRYRLAMDISTGLDDIHAHGVLHRDLKSLNVLLDSNLRAKLTDFGLAGIRSASSRHSSAKGTPHWMAPEVINGDPATEGSDVYSLGMVLWELATHRQPYAHLSNPMQIMFQVAQGKLETLPENCPANFKQLILDCWSSASKRPKAAEVTTRLQPMLESKAAPSTALLASVSLTSMPNYQKPAPALPPQPLKPKETNAQQPSLLASVSLASNPHYQPQAVAVKAKFQEPPEEKSAGLEAFQKGYQLYAQGQYQKALPYFQQSAKEHYPPVYLYLGRMYEEGFGVVKDPGESAINYDQAQRQEAWFIERAVSGDVEGQYYLGRYYDLAAGIKKDPIQTVNWYRRAAEQGNAAAQYNLGFCYENGQGVVKDDKEAVTWYRKAAEQGNAQAQFNLGCFYAKGQGIAQDHGQAVVWYRRAAEQGHATAQSWLGYCYANGQGVTQNYGQAVTWFRRAAEQGHAIAQYYLGVCYADGQGVKQDAKEAVNWHRRAAEQGHAEAQYKLCVHYDNGQGVVQDYGQAVTWCRRAAEQGYAQAQSALGWSYEKGQGVKQDAKEAVTWYRRAAEQGHATAQSWLGYCYANGRGVTQDYGQAVTWFRRAAEQGEAVAQCKLGDCYAAGQGVSKDLQQAKHWYEKAAAQGNETAKANLRSLLQVNPLLANSSNSSSTAGSAKLDIKQGVHNQVKTAPRPQPQEDKIGHIEAFQKGEQLYWQGQYQKALPFFQRAAKNHYPPAYLYLGCMHEFEQGVVKDHGESISWFSKAQAQETWFTEQAAKGNATGQRHLGGYYQFAAGAKKDLTKAVIWYRRAAEQGDARAQINLGACYDAGQGVTQDYAQAVSWYRQAAEREFAMAQCMLGVCYQQGKGVAQNYAQAVSWYRRAAEQGYAAAQYNLGYCYETGRGLSKTPQLAKQWYEKAAAQSNEDAITALAALLKANPSLASNPSSFFAASSRSKPDNKVEAKQALNNPPPVPPKPVPQKSAAPVVVDEKALGQLLKCVAEGEQDQAEALIKKDSKLLLAAGKVTDLSGRTFDNITAFQYALWAMDYHMWTMIQKYLPTEAQAKQHTMLESKGTAHGKHFDLQPLLEALKTYVDKHGTFFFNGVKHWSKKVGGAQKLLPAHVVNEYCRRDRQFKPCSSKWTSPLPRSRAVFNSELDNGSWFTPFSPSESLGVSFAFYRSAGWGRLAMASAATSDGGIAACGAAWPAEDLKSLQSLWNARTEQLKSLADSLAAESQSTLQVSPKK